MPARDYIRRLAEQRYDGEIRNTLLRIIDGIAADADLELIARLIERGDIEGAVAAAGFDAERFEALRDVERRAMTRAGQETTKAIPPRRTPDDRILSVAFDPGNRRAEQAVDQLHTNLIREVTDETRAAMRDEIRDGIRRGENPRATARRIRGRWDRQARAFRGGVLGLTQSQAENVRRAEAQLRSADATELRRYLGRQLRDRRFDRSVLLAIREERALPESIIRNATDGYRRKSVQRRAETIARDQSLAALDLGQDEAFDQARDQGVVREEEIIQEWLTAGDDRVRDAHASVPSMNPGGRRRGEMFDTPFGPLKRPRDRGSPGSVPENLIQCRCTLTARVRRQEARP